jgi:hypothetical protein
MTFDEALKLLNEKFLGYCDLQVFWDATSAVHASETAGHLDLSGRLKEILTFLAPLMQISVLLTVVHHAFAMLHPEGIHGGEYLVPEGVKDDAMDERRMKTVIRLKNVVPLAVYASLYAGILYLILAQK